MADGLTKEERGFITYGKDGFEGMRKAGRLAAETLDFITAYVKPGISTGELNGLCHDFILQNNATPAPLNYRGFPKSICTSINHVVCHGIPDEKRVLRGGDSINIDVTVILDGWHGDTSRMFLVGKPSVKDRRLASITYNCLMYAIDIVKPGTRLGDIGAVIQEYAESQGCSVVRDFCGHGLGLQFHTPPGILHYGRADTGPRLREGMFFTIEPMINLGKEGVKILKDGWTAVTRDKSLSMQFEHSLGVTADGCEIFTVSPKGWHQPPYD